MAHISCPPLPPFKKIYYGHILEGRNFEPCDTQNNELVMTSYVSLYDMRTLETITPWFLMTDFSSNPKSSGRGVRAAEAQIQPIFLLTSCSDVVMQ